MSKSDLRARAAAILVGLAALAPLSGRAEGRLPWSLEAHTGVGVGEESAGDRTGWVALARVAVGVEVHPRVQLQLGLVGARLDMECDGCSDETAGGGLDLGLRLQLARWRSVPLELEVAGGSLWTDDAWPRGGTRQNFLIRLELRSAFPLGSRASLRTGVQWFHLSNAARRGRSRNPGFDAALFSLGLQIPF
ncbi:MAG: acyloxyacyl hydrolase [Proteobacteria bacterium]|nr:acyloxyacyl hydrolase [Pseudomonadota bacterium]